jgi:hypothetical protein
MLLIILALFWVALLTPVVVRRFREGGTEKSIDSFHAEHEVLSRQEYAMTPAHRLDDSDHHQNHEQEPVRRPRLTVVHDNDTYRSLETRGSWDEWAEDYDYDQEDEAPRRREFSNRYAAAYSSVPSGPVVSAYREPPVRRRSMKAQRRMILTRLALVVATTTILGVTTGYSILVDLAVLTWIGFAVFLALALYAVSQGYLFESSLGIRLPSVRSMATVQPLYYDTDDEYDTEAESEFYDAESAGQWRRESSPGYALG